ncbi:hypothetical protein Gotri_019485 [Gossypium trilobum]|uniref:Uncharacterized protein n=1 Tax=Gossypium trilobum TaxID=34281 RepID=A0A7J9EDU1_9ROSI|nr:hypothetical protein [Gossypium trilobum]
MNFFINVETLTGSLYSGYEELLGMPLYLYRDSIGQGILYLQRKGWLNVSLQSMTMSSHLVKKVLDR